MPIVDLRTGGNDELVRQLANMQMLQNGLASVGQIGGAFQAQDQRQALAQVLMGTPAQQGTGLSGGQAGLNPALAGPALAMTGGGMAQPAIPGMIETGSLTPQMAEAFILGGGDPQSLMGLMPQAGEGFTLAPGAVRYNAAGQPIAAAPGEAGRMSGLALVARDLGVDIRTPEGLAAAQAAMAGSSRAPSTTINMPGELPPNPFGEQGMKLLGERASAVSQAQSVLPLIQGARAALDAGAQTGLGEESLLPVRRLAATLGVQDPNLPATELFAALSARLTPLLRPSGSGSTSDADMALYQAAAPNLGRTPEGNRLLIDGFEQLHGRQLQELRIQEQMLSTGSYTPSAYFQQLQQLGPVFDDRYRERLGGALSAPPAAGGGIVDRGMDLLRQGVGAIMPGDPAQAAPTTGEGIGEGTIATNPSTGESLILRNGQWVPL